MEIYERNRQSVYRLALTWLKVPADAEDVCQTAFLRLIEHIDDIRPGRERAWLASVTVNLCRDRLRAAQRRRTVPLDSELPFEDPERSPVLDAIMELGEKERAAVYLHYVEGYSAAETAKLLGTTVTAVTTRLSRARAHLRKRLEGVI